MANIILFSHGQLATGLADSCKLIIGENHFKVLNILLDQNIKEIILPDTIVTIEDFAFAYSTLEYLTLPDSVKTIGEYAFV